MSTPLTPYTVSLILTYICPPSQLALSPLSAHLISKPLLQRHHFLNIDPELDTKSYLMWASEEDQVFTKLEGLEPPSSRDEEPIMGIRYTADQESVFAHAELRSLASQASADIRLVFMWDPVDSTWKYHNLTSMPFPVDATYSVVDAVATHNDTIEHEHGDDGNDYWDSYGHYNEKEYLHISKSRDDDLSEDAYWAQYASIQGTADSTIPTPKLEPETPDDETYDNALARARGLKKYESEEAIIDISYDSLNIAPPSRNPVADPRDASSPTDLSDRLSALPPRSPVPHPEIITDFDTMNKTVGINGKLNGHSDEPGENSVDAAVVVVDDGSQSSSTPQQTGGMNSMDEHTKSAIRGVYNMWKLSCCAQSVSKDQFMQLVEEAIVGS